MQLRPRPGRLAAPVAASSTRSRAARSRPLIRRSPNRTRESQMPSPARWAAIGPQPQVTASTSALSAARRRQRRDAGGVAFLPAPQA